MKYYLAFIAIIIVLFIGAKVIFSPSKKSPDSTGTSTALAKGLVDLASTNAEVSVTIEGPVLGNEQHRAIRISVNSDERTLDVIQGYDGLSIQHNTFDNTTEAYRVFLRAIEGDGFTRNQKATVADDRGICPTGTKYIYEIKNSGDSRTDQRYWSVSCGLTIGSAAGVGPAIRDMFQKQIPDFATLTLGVNVFPPVKEKQTTLLL